IAAGVGQWCCPSFLLAERKPPATGRDAKSAPYSIRVTANALSDLVIDLAADFGSPELAGFTLENVENQAKLIAVRLCPDNPLDLFLDCDMALEGDNILLRYASGQTVQSEDAIDPVGYAHNRGCIRDSWHAVSADGRKLHRWALPCVLPVH
ncbi:hypothetical protein JI58_08755, partial [Marinosulfonomonas sp. PRT-SC04]